MKVITAAIGPFRSINASQLLSVCDEVTVLVGMNEAGKTVVLKALEKADDALGLAKFDPVDDFPRKDLSAYLRRHATEPAVAVTLAYRLEPEEVIKANEELGTELSIGFEFSINHQYDNEIKINLSVAERPVLEGHYYLTRGLAQT